MPTTTRARGPAPRDGAGPRTLRVLAAALLAGAGVAAAAGPDSPVEPPRLVPDGFLERYAETYRFRLGQPTALRTTEDGRHVLFLRSPPRSFERDLYELDLATGEERVVLRAAQLLGGAEETLTAEEKARRERMRVVARGIASFELSADDARLVVPLGGRLFVVERATGAVRELDGEGTPIDARFSPDGRKVACVRDGELHVADLDSGEQRQLTSGAGGTVSHAVAEFVAQEEMNRHHGYWWSPDSRRIAYQRTDTAGVEVLHVADAMHPERVPDGWAYPRAGRRNADVRLGIVPVEGGETRWVAWDRERYEYLAAVRWTSDAPLTILVQNRRQTEELLLAVDARDGSTRKLLVERDPAWLNLFPGMPHWLPGGRRFLWITERNGAPQLELRDRDGGLVAPLHEPGLGLQRFEHRLGNKRAAIVRASEDPTESHLYRVSLDPERHGVERLTRETGVHTVASEGASERFVVRTATPDGATPVYRVADGDGPGRRVVRSIAEDPGFVPRLEFTTAGEGPRFHAVLVRPSSFDPQRRYPVIVHVYGGPGSQTVRRDGGRYLLDQWFAERGYIVVWIDGRGTPGRGREWERAIKGDLIGLSLADQERALRALGERHPELDLARVGIHGWSFGGYFSAMAVLRLPELFRAGIAGAPVVTWEDYDTHYTERYMDLPQDNPSGYAAASVLTYAPALSRPLLIVHGTADDNVYFTHSLKLADALLRGGRQFDFLPLPGFTHMVPEPEMTDRLYRRMVALFDRHLR